MLLCIRAVRLEVGISVSSLVARSTKPVNRQAMFFCVPSKMVAVWNAILSAFLAFGWALNFSPSHGIAHSAFSQQVFNRLSWICYQSIFPTLATTLHGSGSHLFYIAQSVQAIVFIVLGLAFGSASHLSQEHCLSARMPLSVSRLGCVVNISPMLAILFNPTAHSDAVFALASHREHYSRGRN